MVNLWGPGAFDCLNPSAAEPTFTPDNAPGDVDDWFKDCSSPLLADGTEWRSALLNKLIANLRWVVRGSGTPDNNLDPKLLAKAVQSGGMNFAVATGTANAWTVALNLALTAYVAGRVLWLKAPATNTNTTVTVTIDGLAARPLKKADGSLPAVGDLVAGRWYPTIDDGSSICVVESLPSDIRSAAFKVSRTVITATGALNFVVPANVSIIRFSLWAAGGGGGSGGSGGAASGGSSGSYLQKTVDVTPGATLTGSVGVGGSAGVWGGTLNGSAGGATTLVVNGVTYTAAGGPGGLGQNGAGGASSPLPATAPTQGDINLQGGQGAFGINATSPSVASGNGANAPLGGLGGVGGGGSGSAGSAPGAGGAGGASGLAAGSGARGEVWIEY